MQFFMLARRKTESFGEEQFAELLDAEAAQVRKLYGEGSVRAAYSRGDVLGAVLLLEAENEEAAKRIIASLPLAQRGMLETQIVPVRGYRGFS